MAVDDWVTFLDAESVGSTELSGATVDGQKSVSVLSTAPSSARPGEPGLTAEVRLNHHKPRGGNKRRKASRCLWRWHVTPTTTTSEAHSFTHCKYFFLLSLDCNPTRISGIWSPTSLNPLHRDSVPGEPRWNGSRQRSCCRSGSGRRRN